jgi:hypothetical protein
VGRELLIQPHFKSRVIAEGWSGGRQSCAVTHKGALHALLHIRSAATISQSEEKPSDFGTREHEKVRHSTRYPPLSHSPKTIPLSGLLLKKLLNPNIKNLLYYLSIVC